MFSKINRPIIATLALCSWGIFSCPVFADEDNNSVMVSEIPLSKDTLPETSTSPKIDSKASLFEATKIPWLDTSLHSLETFQVWLGGHVQNTGDGIDNYFGRSESFERTRGNRLDIMMPVVLHDDGSVETQVRFRAKLALTKLKKNLHLLVFSQQSTLKNNPQNTLPSEANEGEEPFSLALQALLDATEQNEIYLDVGVKLADVIKPDPYVRLQKRFNWNADNGWNTRMTQTLFWERVDGSGLDSKYVFDKPIDPRYLFRAQTDGTWWQDEHYYELTQRLLLYNTVNVHRIFTHQAWANHDTLTGSFKKTSYGLTSNWRERVYKNWLYFEVEPGIRWVNDNAFSDPDITLMLMLEMRFFKVL